MSTLHERSHFTCRRKTRAFDADHTSAQPLATWPPLFTDAYLRLSKGLREIAQSESDIRPLDLANAVQVIKDIDDDCRYPPTQTTSNVD